MITVPAHELLALRDDAPAAELVAKLDATRPIRDLVVQNLDAVWRTARRLGLHEAELDDLTQEVALVAMRRSATIESGRERAFMLATAVRIAANWRRARRRRTQRRAELADDLSDGGGLEVAAPPAQERALERAHGWALLDAALSEMTEGQRAAFILFELEELSAKEIAEELEIPEAAVVSRVRRAREVFQRFCRRCQAASGDRR
jgi:RNA polymerase sigma-70 factor (ECF subfamily)